MNNQVENLFISLFVLKRWNRMELPEAFRSTTKEILGDEYEAFEKALAGVSPTSIRINEHKLNLCPRGENVPWCKSGYYLSDRPSFTMDPLIHAGGYYVQEASSMFLEQVFAQLVEQDSPRVLDLCAAPGGKSTHLASLLNGHGLLVSNEVIRTRAKILSENLTKWGAPNVVVTNNDPKDFSHLKGFFDLVFVDAPCSGEGMFRKDPQSITEWTVDNVKLCSERQRRIVADIFPTLKSEGLLVYSTCTYNREEDEENVKWMAENLGAEVLPLNLDGSWGVSTSGLGYHFYPHKTKGEGFFLAVLRKTEDESEFRIRFSKEKENKKIAVPDVVRTWLTHPDDYKIWSNADSFYAIPAKQEAYIKTLKAELNVIQSGISLGCLKGKDVLPDESLALSWIINKRAFETADLEWKDAIAFLKKDNILLPDSGKGWVMVQFEGVPLGFAKNLGNRVNNAYPQEWRIRMEVDASKYAPLFSFEK